MFVQVTNIRVAAQKPEQLVDDRFEVELFGREERKSLPQIEPRLRAENGDCARASSIHARLSLFEHQPKQIVVLAHADFR